MTAVTPSAAVHLWWSVVPPPDGDPMWLPKCQLENLPVSVFCGTARQTLDEIKAIKAEFGTWVDLFVTLRTADGCKVSIRELEAAAAPGR